MLSDQQLLKILARSTGATAIYDSEDLHIRFVNDAMLALWGKGPDILHATFSEALPELKDQPSETLLKKAWISGQAFHAANTMATLEVDGQLKTAYFDFEYLPLSDDNGNTYAILHTARNVNDRAPATQQVVEKQAHEQRLIGQLTQHSHDINEANSHIARLNERLLESKTDFMRLIRQAPVAILVFRGADLIIDQVNLAMLEILGKDDRIIGQPLLKGLPEIEGAPAVNMLFDVFRHGKSFDGNEEPVPILTNGVVKTRYFNFSYRPLFDNGQIVGVMDVAVEVTEQVLARQHLENIINEKIQLERVLRANEQRLQGILDTMAEGVIIVDAACRPTYANLMAQRIMGIDETGFKDRLYDDDKWKNQRLDGSALPAEEHPLYITVRTGIAKYDQEVAVLFESGKRIYISINTAPLMDEHGQIAGGIATFTDVTSRRMILQQKDDFISVASHELKTPITSLVASLQLLDIMQGDITPDKQSELIRQANKSATKLRGLVNSLLSSNRITQGRFPVYKKRFTLSHLVRECSQYIHTIEKHEVVLTGDMELQVEADEQLIDQVMLNLLNNAVKYAPDSERIIVHIERQETEAKVTVQDFGPGIPKDKVPYLFERYYQASSPQNGLSGLGLGLYISAEIIEKHGGRIGVDSEPGQGSKFWFTLPL